MTGRKGRVVRDARGQGVFQLRAKPDSAEMDSLNVREAGPPPCLCLQRSIVNDCRFGLYLQLFCVHRIPLIPNELHLALSDMKGLHGWHQHSFSPQCILLYGALVSVPQ